MTGAPGTLAGILAQTANAMVAEYEESRTVQHRASKGMLRESLVLDRFLRKYMPKNVAVHGSGELCSVDGTRSSQCDLLVVDPTAPFLLEKSDYRIAAVESVFGIIEVKSNLTTTELIQSYKKIAAIKAMPKTAFRPALGLERTRCVYGRTWTHMPMVGMIFAYEGAELDTLGNAMAEVAADYADQPQLQVDSVWVLRRGSLTWADPVTHRINASPNPGDAFQAISSTPGQVLLHFAAHLHEQFAAAWTTGLNLFEYLKSENLGHHVQAWAPDSTNEDQEPNSLTKSS